MSRAETTDITVRPNPPQGRRWRMADTLEPVQRIEDPRTRKDQDTRPCTVGIRPDTQRVTQSSPTLSLCTRVRDSPHSSPRCLESPECLIPNSTGVYSLPLRQRSSFLPVLEVSRSRVVDP